jgi:hypothetical protein
MIALMLLSSIVLFERVFPVFLLFSCMCFFPVRLSCVFFLQRADSTPSYIDWGSFNLGRFLLAHGGWERGFSAFFFMGLRLFIGKV